MDLLRWIQARPGTTDSTENGIVEVRHRSGDTSLLWLGEQRLGYAAGSRAALLTDLFGRVDGADLFCSAFKVASVATPRMLGGTIVVPSLAQLCEASEAEGAFFPSGVIVFMEQAGIGFYGLDPVTGRILEWDQDAERVRRTFESPYIVFEEWLAAVGDG